MKTKVALAVLVLLITLLGGAAYFFWNRPQREPARGAQQQGEASQAMPERVELKAGDGISIVGDYYAPAVSSARGVLLLHMMPATRASWQALAGKLVVFRFSRARG